jgi:hypothetical protein
MISRQTPEQKSYLASGDCQVRNSACGVTYRIEWVTVISAGMMGSNAALLSIILSNVADKGCSTEKEQGIRR